MGLDMYLDKKIYIGAEYDHLKIEGVIYITTNGKRIPVDFKKVSEIIERAAYWRKANHIHNWFVNNVQDGEDNCQESYVSHDQLVTLKNTCKAVIASLEGGATKKATIKTGWANGKDTFEDIDVFADTSTAEELLPVQSGFFFGLTEYDEYYLSNLKETVEALSGLDPDASYYYHASW